MIAIDQPVPLRAALRHDTIRRAIEIDGRVSIAEAEIKQAMVRLAGKTVFLADHDKIGHVASAFVTDYLGRGSVDHRCRSRCIGAFQPGRQRAGHRGGPFEREMSERRGIDCGA